MKEGQREKFWQRLERQGAVREHGAIDVSRLPSYGFGFRSVMWWGTLGVVAIEGTVFAMVIVTYFYLRTHVDAWPPGVPAPSLFWGTLNTFVLLGSLIPNELAKHAAERNDKTACKVWLPLCVVFALLFLTLRVFEFRSLNVQWYTNAYGSVVWFLMGLHTFHLITDFWDTAVLGALLFAGPWEGKRFVDVQENALYWNFVVAAWLPIYAVVYWGGRF